MNNHQIDFVGRLFGQPILFCKSIICSGVELSFVILYVLYLKWKFSLFQQQRELEVIICSWWQKINPECVLNSHSGLQTLSLDTVTALGSSSSNHLPSLLTFCATLAALLPIKPFITPKSVFLTSKAGWLVWKLFSLMYWGLWGTSLFFLFHIGAIITKDPSVDCKIHPATQLKESCYQKYMYF